jgi:ribosomal-protein-alanine N-acetyltransferase
MDTPTLQTSRLILRPIALSDVPAIQRHFNNWNIIRNLATIVPWPYPDDGAETFVRLQLEKIAAGDEVYSWVLVLRSGDGEAIGNIRFHSWSDSPKGNRGFWLAESYWRQGLMTEAVAAVNDFAFRTLGVESFHVCNAAGNEASRRVKQKTGAELIGYIELPHHNGESKAEKWRVTRENWLRRGVAK